MTTVTRTRDIVDPARLGKALGALIPDEGAATPETRGRMLALLKAALEAGRGEIRTRFEAGASGEATVAANAYLMDQVVRAIAEFAGTRVYPATGFTEGERISIAAVGGYGRGELAPYSDLDLLFLIPYKVTARLEQIVEFVLYALWDCGLKVGHATRSVEDCIRRSKDDFTIRTAVLEARYLWGERTLFDELRRRFARDVAAGTGARFVEAKLAERDQRHARMGGSRYVLEPNVKDGKGGLRDLQTLFWLGKYLYQVDTVADLVERGVLTAREAARFAKAQNFLVTVRCHLHYLTGRGEDRLTFDLQSDLGVRMGYQDHAGTSGVERFMKHYYLTAKETGDLTRIFCAALEAEHRTRPRFSLSGLNLFRKEIDGFKVESGRLTVASGRAFSEEPVKMIRMFHAAQAHDLDIHPNALRLITRNLRLVDTLRDDAEANRLFLEMLTSPKGPEITLRRMNEAGVFGRFIPDFGRVVAQMQHDMYHVFTVDEHTIFALGILHQIEQGEYADTMPASSAAVHKVGSRNALYLAVLLHDIAKGRGGNHSELGADIALRLGPRLGLSDEETETTAWLVRHHLLLSATAFHRDINEPQTINDFVAVVQSLDRLRALLVLTVADIRAVGPNVWNAWKASLIREFYYAAEEVLSGGHAAEGREVRVAAAQDALRRRLDGWTEAAIETQIGRGYQPYWLAFDTDTHVRHAELVRGAETDEAPLTVDMFTDTLRGVCEVTIYTADHAGLFSGMAGAMALSGANIVDAKIFTMTNGMALDVFWIQGLAGEPFDQPEQMARLRRRIEQTLAGQLNPGRELAGRPAIPSRTRVFTVAPRVLIDNAASRTHSVIEVNGRDRPALLHDVTRAFTEFGLQISSAQITTYGERAVDVFYVKDAFGMQVSFEAKLKQIREGLLRVLADPDAPGEKKPRAKPAAPRKRTAKSSRKSPAAAPKKKKPATAGRAKRPARRRADSKAAR